MEYLHPRDLSYLDHVGFVHDCVAYFAKDCADDRIDPDVYRAMSKVGLLDKFNMESYGRIRETHFGALKGIQKYDVLHEDPDLDFEILSQAKTLLFKEFSPYENSCPLTTDDEVIMPHDTHCGFEYRRQGYRTKGDVLRSPLKRQELIDSFSNLTFPTIWKGAAKGGELLKRSKLANNDARLFLIPGLKLHYLTCRLFQKQHELMTKLGLDPQFWFKIGYTFQYGGFTHLMRCLSQNPHFVEGDAEKYDRSLLEFVVLFFIIPLRLYLYRAGPELSKQQYEVVLRFVYHDVMHTVVVLPNGQIIVKHGGMPSGYYLTGDDNSLSHYAVKLSMYAYYRAVDSMYLDKWYMYADDHIASLYDPRMQDYEKRAFIYRKFNISLSKEKDKVSDDLSGHSFLGFTARWHEGANCYVPVFNFEKAMCSALKSGSKQSPVLRYIRVSAYRVLCYFHPNYELIRELALQLLDRSWEEQYRRGVLTADDIGVDDKISAGLNYLIGFPSDRDIEHLWLGYERGGSEGIIEDSQNILLNEIIAFAQTI